MFDESFDKVEADNKSADLRKLLLPRLRTIEVKNGGKRAAVVGLG